MKTALCSALAFGACASVALAEPASPAVGPNGDATAEAHPAGPIALTEAEMDKITGGTFPADMFLKLEGVPGESRDALSSPTLGFGTAWSWGEHK